MTATKDKVTTCVEYLVRTTKQKHTCYKCVSPLVKITKAAWRESLFIEFPKQQILIVSLRSIFIPSSKTFIIHMPEMCSVLTQDYTGQNQSINVTAWKLWSQWFTKQACILCSKTKLHVPWVMGSSILLAIQLALNLNLIRFLFETLLG